jgi:hypothetical protein
MDNIFMMLRMTIPSLTPRLKSGTSIPIKSKKTFQNTVNNTGGARVVVKGTNRNSVASVRGELDVTQMTALWEGSGSDLKHLDKSMKKGISGNQTLQAFLRLFKPSSVFPKGKSKPETLLSSTGIPLATTSKGSQKNPFIIGEVLDISREAVERSKLGSSPLAPTQTYGARPYHLPAWYW